MSNSYEVDDQFDDKPKNTKLVGRRLIKVIGEQRMRITLILLAALGYSILTIIAPMISSQIIDSLYQMIKEPLLQGGVGTVMRFAGSGLVLILIVYMLTSLFSLVQERLMASVSENVTLSLKKKVIVKLNRSPLAYFDQNQTGELLSRVSNDMERISEALQMSTIQLLTSVFTVIGSVVMMARMSVLLTAIALFFILVSMLITKVVAAKNLKYASARQQKQGILNSEIEEKYTGRVIIKSFNRENESSMEVFKANQALYTANFKADFMTHAVNPLIRFTNRIGYVLIAVLSGMLFLQGQITIGNIQAFIQYVNQLTEPLAQASFGINSLQSALASAERIFDIMDSPDEVKDADSTIGLPDIRGDLQFSHVAFGYSETLLMEDINLDIDAGKMVAIVGPTGAGKTTLVNILMRFYELKGGRILIDGVDITALKRHELRQKFGMVLQDTWLFEGTIAENIAYGKPDASMEEIVEAAKQAKADYFIRTLPHGYNSVLSNDGTSLSAGQKQLLTIARAMLSDPPILILDEATSSVDTRTELAIQEAMNALMKNRTSLVIAHRLSTIRNADKILVMNHGTIIEQGNHHELMEAEGFYHRLYNSQFAK